MKQFCMLQLPYFYLNRLQRLDVKVEDGAYTAFFSDDVVSSGKEKRITKSGVVLKDGGDVLLPLDADCKTFIAYSENGKTGVWNIPDAVFARADVFSVTRTGNVPRGSVEIRNGNVQLDVPAGCAYVLKEA